MIRTSPRATPVLPCLSGVEPSRLSLRTPQRIRTEQSHHSRARFGEIGVRCEVGRGGSGCLRRNGPLA